MSAPNRFLCLIVLSLGLLVLLGSPSAHAQTTMQLATPDVTDAEGEKQRELEREAQEWREGIPDYEFRLQQRVEALDTRASELKIIVFAGLAVSLSLLAVIVFLVLQHDIGQARTTIKAFGQAFINTTSSVFSRGRSDGDRGTGEAQKSSRQNEADEPQMTWRGKVVSVLLVVLFSFVAGELYLRKFDPRDAMVNVVPHLWNVSWCWNYTYKPGAYQTQLPMPDGSTWNISATRYGFRSNHPVGRMEEIKESPAPDTIRIAVIGASYTAGWGVDDVDSWPARLERALNDSYLLGKNVEVLNFAAPGRGAFSNIIKGYLCDMHRFNPDILLFEIEPVNQNDIPSPEAIERFKGPAPEDWVYKSQLYVDDSGFLRSFAPGMDFFKPLARESRLIATALYQIYLIKLKLFQSDTLQTSASLFEFVADSEDATLKNTLFAMKFFKSEGILAIPVFRQRISPEAFDKAGYGLIDPIRDVTNGLSEYGLPAINSALYLDNEQEDVIRGDSHWSPTGHRKVTKGVLDKLRSLAPEISSRAAISSYIDSLDVPDSTNAGSPSLN